MYTNKNVHQFLLASDRGEKAGGYFHQCYGAIGWNPAKLLFRIMYTSHDNGPTFSISYRTGGGFMAISNNFSALNSVLFREWL